VEFEWDEAKRLNDIAKHGVDFDAVAAFEWGSAKEAEDRRYDYSEARWVARGRIGGQLHVLIYTRRNGRIRVISLREASRREKANYAKNET
jgi:uncharacterized DUF497 family protein